MSTLSTHVLNTNVGRPAEGMAVQLDRLGKQGWENLSTHITNDEGRVSDLTDGPVAKGTYRLTFATQDYFNKTGEKCFYPEASIVFELDGDEHYHVPLLVSAWGYSTYRGS